MSFPLIFGIKVAYLNSTLQITLYPGCKERLGWARLCMAVSWLVCTQLVEL